MVARVWHGYAATQEHADAYEALLKPELLPGISTKKGYRGSHLLRRTAGDEIEFITILFFDTLDDIKAITGPDYETAVIPQERRQYLSRFDAKAVHYEVPTIHGLTTSFS
jgi:antibiotic biosynthesis monooxygenase (ABM) superfamily enzyme